MGIRPENDKSRASRGTTGLEQGKTSMQVG